MKSLNRYNLKLFGIEVLGILLAIVFLIPFYFVVTNSFKPFVELSANSLSLPKALTIDNYINAWRIMDFSTVFVNSIFITIVSNIGLVIISSMAAYRLLRVNNRMSQIIFMLFVAAMVIPFETLMIPLVKLVGAAGLLNSMWGLIICYFGFGVSLNLFLYHGFIKSIPVEIEEAAILDGCSSFGVFWRIVFPLLKPITITIILLNSIWIWSDFLLPLLIIGGSDNLTIPLSTFSFFSEYTKQWDLALAALGLSIFPIITFFLILQRYIVEGITAGSVKG